jgi:hypothetical protein
MPNRQPEDLFQELQQKAEEALGAAIVFVSENNNGWSPVWAGEGDPLTNLTTRVKSGEKPIGLVWFNANSENCHACKHLFTEYENDSTALTWLNNALEIARDMAATQMCYIKMSRS